MSEMTGTATPNTETVQTAVKKDRNAKKKNMAKPVTLAKRRARTGYMFILPFIIGFFLFMLKPLVQAFIMSFSEVTLTQTGSVLNWVGTLNYHYAWSVDGLERKNEFYNMMAGVAESVEGAAGVNISASLQDLLSVSGVGSEVFKVIFDMIDAIYDIVMASGIQIIIFLTGLQAISPSLYEAADVEGCTAWESFWKITFPMVSPLLLVNCIYTIIDFFTKNDSTVMDRIYEVSYNLGEIGRGAAMSWIYFAVSLAFVLISSFIISRAVKSAQ